MAPIDKNYFHQALHYFFPGNCFEELIVNLNVLDKKCSPILVSRLLGVLITVGSSILFVPQIIKIYRAKSGTGISLWSQVLGLTAAAGTAAYNYEKGFVFGQWGDSLFVAIQMIIIIMQILWYANARPSAFAFMAWCWCVGSAVAYHYVPINILSAVQGSTLPIILVSKGLQIVVNYRQGGTGQLSVMSVFMQFGGCVARVFTSVQETGDWLLIAPYILSSVLNGLVFVQILYYSFRTPKKYHAPKASTAAKKKRN